MLPSSPVWLQGDGRRLEQVFVNLLVNACKFTDTGGELAVRLHISGGQAMVHGGSVMVRSAGRGRGSLQFNCQRKADSRARRCAAAPTPMDRLTSSACPA